MQVIYKIVNKVNGKFYIGSTNNLIKRWRNHKSSLNRNVHENSYLQKAWNKYGEAAFEFFVLEEVNDDNRIEREIYYINETKCYDRDIGYNFDKNPSDKSGANNPFYGKNHKEQTKQKLRLIANNRSDELKARMGEKNKGGGHPKAILNWHKVEQIRKLYSSGEHTYVSLSKMYCVSKGAIQAIIENRSWKT